MVSFNRKAIVERLHSFVQEFQDVTDERANAQYFWFRFFQAFGIDRTLIDSFEHKTKNIQGNFGRIDVYWEGVLLVEHKSKGADLAKAESQAFSYIQSLSREKRKIKLPRHIILCDFANFILHDEGDEEKGIPKSEHRFTLQELTDKVDLFRFLVEEEYGYIEKQEELNIQAVELLGKLHDMFEDRRYPKEALDKYIVRVLFCLFADDTGIFESHAHEQILVRTSEDGADVGAVLENFYSILNTPEDDRQITEHEFFKDLPYVNGGLFADKLPIPSFSKEMRDQILRCARFDWSQISPAVFGSLFQSIMEPKERRQYGAHYTSEQNIMKVIKPLFLDDLREEFEASKHSKPKLEALKAKIASLKLLDPACGCGNFLVIAYRELRVLEIDILRRLYPKKVQREMYVLDHLSKVNVDQFYGIEIEEWPARIAQVAMWLMDHVMNRRLSSEFGHVYIRLPLKRSATIIHANALRLDWNDVLPKEQCSYVLGNPPFIGAKFQTDEQRQEMELVACDVQNYGLLDYVTAWYFKAAKYIKGTAVRVGFVSTNSISQGEQVGVLWNALFATGMTIQFGYRTFVWDRDARGKAHVHVVIIGFSAVEGVTKLLLDETNGQIERTEVRAISPYLIEGESFAIINRTKPLCNVPEIGIGNKPIDGGHYLFLPDEKEEFLKQEPGAERFFRRWLGAEEFINGKERWCLWLGDCPPDELKKMPHALKRIEAVRQYRLESKSAPTRKIASTPTRFHVECFPQSTFLVVPGVSSERRPFIPIGYLTPDVIASNLLNVVKNATLYHFGVLSSTMHMDWMRQVAGRLESRYRYSAGLVYNNFPWPQGMDETKEQEVAKAAQTVLDARAKYPTSTLADLYDPNTMPPDLVKAHAALDRAVDKCYRKEPFKSERERVEFLFKLYQEITASIDSQNKKPRKQKDG